MSGGAQEVVIIGAARSGTNMLRDVLTALDGVDTWPCDEINYIWRHGNVRWPDDEIPADRATPQVSGYVNRAFHSIRRSSGASTIVEKTCANSLRVAFVASILPEARYVFIVRDGVDAAVSASQRWSAALDIPYLAKKARYVPVSDLPYYASRYAVTRLHRLTSRENRLSTWGPRFAGMKEALEEHDLLTVCGLQWQRSVELAADALAQMPDSRVVHVRYEELVADPVVQSARVANELGLRVDRERVERAVSGVSASSVGKGRQSIGPERVAALEDMVGETLARHGYA